VLDIYL